MLICFNLGLSFVLRFFRERQEFLDLFEFSLN